MQPRSPTPQQAPLPAVDQTPPPLEQEVVRQRHAPDARVASDLPTSALCLAVDAELGQVMADVRGRLAAACHGLPRAAFEGLVRQISERKLAWQARDEQALPAVGPR